MRRQKTNVPFDIPLLPDLIEELKLHPINGLAFMMTERGKPFGAAGFGNKFGRGATRRGCGNARRMVCARPPLSVTRSTARARSS